MIIPEGTKTTPMLQQYVKWKEQYPDCLLFFRIGDFYEMFFDDAKIASSVLDIVLTSRSKDSTNAVPMAGVPYHAVNSYLGRLVAAGYRVAICDQISQPDGKNLVQRDITRIVTPGTWLPEDSESESKLAACVINNDTMSVSMLATGTGTLLAGTFTLERSIALLMSYKPDEILLKKGQSELFKKAVAGLINCTSVERESGEFEPTHASKWLCRKWDVATLNSMGFDDRDPAVGVAAAVLRYLEETQFSKAEHVHSIAPILQKKNLILDQSTQLNLELTEPYSTSLYSILNKCKTVMGKRLLKSWILSPLQDIDDIKKRQNSVEFCINNRQIAKEITSHLYNCRDIARSVGRLTLRMGLPSDLSAIRDTLNELPAIKELTAQTILADWAVLPDLSEISQLLNSALAENPSRLVREGGVIKDGYNEKLDYWRSLSRDSSAWLKEYEEKERARTGIKTLKCGVNKVFGYYIEISKGNVDKVPAEYVRKQTLVNGERYITEELKKFENDMFRASDNIILIEQEIYSELVAKTLEDSLSIQTVNEFLSLIDVLVALAEVALQRSYVKPEMDLSSDFVIKNGRHPVIEVALGSQPFTPNDINFSTENGHKIAIITGPNMAGKSTYLRMAALIAIMAHMGSYVPAESARIGIIDRVFTRIGARDELARGQSTFMVEMVETANILRHATNKSLVVLDEVGRGTSTYDGLSIAWSVVEYLSGRGTEQARVLFATHYHELTKLAESYSSIVNLSMAVEERTNGVMFLHSVVEAPADRSYGIEVARLAGVPAAVLKRSRELLQKFENEAAEKEELYMGASKNQMTLFDIKQDAILEELANVNPDSLTPMAALELVYKLNKASKEALKS